MTIKSKQAKSANKLKAPLILTGLGLTLGWALIVAMTGMPVALSCAINPNACDQGVALAQLIIFTPIVIGSIAMPVGVVLYERWSMIVKILFVATVGAALYFISFWVIVFMIIAFHGLQG